MRAVIPLPDADGFRGVDIQARVDRQERALSRITRSDTLHGLIGNGAGLRATWDSLPLTRAHAIVRAVLDHATIAPGTVGTRQFDYHRVHPTWRL